MRQPLASSGGIGAYYTKVLALSPIAYWPLGDKIGSVAEDISGNGFDGAYISVTLGQSGIGDGRTCPLFNGSGSFVNIYSTGFRDAFDGDEGTSIIWAKLFNAGAWGGGAKRVITLEADGTNRVTIRKSSSANQLDLFQVAGGSAKVISKTSISELGWMALGITWSKTGDKVIAYYNGTQEGSTLTGLGSWVGTLVSTKTIIGAGITTPTLLWYGYLAHCAIWDTPLAPAALADLAIV